MPNEWKNLVFNFDERRNYVILKDQQHAIAFCVSHFLALAKAAIEAHGQFSVALSGGSTPKAIFQNLASAKESKLIDWSKVKLFWSDERSVGPEHVDSNYHMAMEAGLKTLPFLPEHIFRMKAEKNIQDEALAYEKLIHEHVPEARFDFVMLGVGEDGHTASLFPNTHALHTTDRLVVANFVPEKETWRMTFTFDCINRARHNAIYALGKAKADIVNQVLKGPYQPNHFPSQKVGTNAHPALWIMDADAAALLDL